MNQSIASPLKRRSDIHWARKLWHMGMVGLMFLCWVLLPDKACYILLAIGWLMFVPLDFARQHSKSLNEGISHLFRPIMREYEANRLAGTTYLLTGVFFIALVFPHPVVSLTLLFLAFADPIASYIGIRFGRDKILNQKSLQGTIAAYVVCAIASFLFVMNANQPLDRSIVFSLVAGAVGALAELIPLYQLDDNLTLPIFSACGLSALFYFFGFWS